MSVPARIQRAVAMTAVAVFGTVVVAFAILVFVRLVAHDTHSAEAASVIYYPNFCLGGWKYPQHASGPAAVTGEYNADQFSSTNSAYLESSTASQLFCGYFSVRNTKNPPTKATVTFNWAFKWPGDTSATDHTDSYTSTSTNPSGISPATGFIPATSTPSTASTTTGSTSGNTGTRNTAAAGDAFGSQGNTNPPPTTPVVPPAAPSTTTELPFVPGSSTTGTDVGSPTNPPADPPADQGTSTTPPDTSAGDMSPSPSGDTSTPPSPTDGSNTSNSTPPPPPPTPDPAPAPAPAPDPAPTPAPAPEGPQSRSLGSFIASLIAEKVEAAETDVTSAAVQTESFKDFLEVSYSLDGIRWTPVGRVNRDNWKDYTIQIPVASWDEVKRLQIMVSVLPTIDEKPEIYLDSISMRAEYNRTVSELAADGLSAVSNAVDTLIGDGNGATNEFDIIPDAPRGPQPIEIRERKLKFPSVGAVIRVMHDVFDDEGRVAGKVASKKISVDTTNAGNSMIVSGSCAKKYFVILTYRGKDDYLKHRGSYVANQAHECQNGTFTFDLASLSSETRDGAQYLVVGEQGAEGTWDVVSDVFPITIEATTTVRTMYQDSGSH